MKEIFYICLAAYGYSLWISWVLPDYLPFATAENIYLSALLGFTFLIFYIVLVPCIPSKLWQKSINYLSYILLLSYWIIKKFGEN
ncbi:hypothetical protein [Acinetobacter variabilis]|uniref:hypothetical protein n=1 Tax=Acinetobacter variabilis TaxID=70346 RepID=UPI0028A81E99|nr:hypothetical protein [Acinetobacter variabilis]